MLKKLYKKNGIIRISKEYDSMKLYYAFIHNLSKKDYYQTLGYIY